MIPVRAYFRLFAEYLRPHRRRAWLLAVVLLVTIGLQLVNPQLIKVFIDRITEGAAVDELVPLAIAFMAVAIAHQVLLVWATYLAEQVGWSATNALRADLTAHVVRLDMGYHKATSPGELIERIDGDVTALSNFFSSMVIKVVGNGFLVVGVMILLMRESWIVGIGIAVFTSLVMLGLVRLHGVTVPWHKAIRATAAETFGFVGEQVDGTEDIEANGATDYMLSRFDEIQEKWQPQVVRGWTGWAMMWSASMGLYFLSLMLGFVLGAWLFGVGTLTLGSVYLVFQYIEMVHRPIEEIREQLVDLQKAGASIERVEELFATESRIVARDARPLPDGPLRLEVDRGEFS